MSQDPRPDLIATIILGVCLVGGLIYVQEWKQNGASQSPPLCVIQGQP